MFFSNMYKCTSRHMINRPTLYFWYCRPMAMIHEINFIIIIYYLILKPLKVFLEGKIFIQIIMFIVASLAVMVIH